MSQWEDAPSADGGWEDAPGEQSSGFMEEVKRRAKAAAGGLDAALTMAAQAGPFIGSGVMAAGALPFVGAENAEGFRQYLLENGLGLGEVKPVTQEGEQIFEGLGKAADFIKEGAGEQVQKARNPYTGGGGEEFGSAARLASDAVLGAWGAFTPIPGGKGVHKLGNALEKFGARNTPAGKAVSKLDEIRAQQAKIDAAAAEPKESAYQPPVDLREATGMAPDPVRNGIPATRTDMLTGNPANADLMAGAREREAANHARAAEAAEASRAESQAVAKQVAQMHDELIKEKLIELDRKATEEHEALRQQYELGPKTQEAFTDLAHKIEQLRAQWELERRQVELERLVQGKTSVKNLHQELLWEHDPRNVNKPSGGRGIEGPVGKFELDPQARDPRGLIPEQVAADRARLEQAPVPGVEQVINRANEQAAADPRTQAAEAKIPGVEERAVNAGDQGPLHQKFMEESLRVAEQNVESLKAEIADTVRKNPTGVPNRVRVKGLKQRGAIGDLSGKKRTVIDDLKDRFGKTDPSFVAEDPKPADVREAAKGEKDIKSVKVLETGSTMTAMKNDSSLVYGGSRMVQNAQKRADLRIRDNVLPTERALRGLKEEEVLLLHQLMMDEMLQGKRYSPDIIDQHLNVKQKEAYAHMRHMFEDTLRIQNEARAAKKQAPITEMEAYLSSRWDGDFRRPVYEAVLNKDGSPKINERGDIEKRLVYYLAADTKHSLNKQWEALHKERPDLMYLPERDHTVKYFKRETDLQSVYSTIMDILGEGDPVVADMREAMNKITQAVKDQTVNEAATFLGQEKHFKEKTGVRGFVGDRPGKQGTVKEALAMFQQQIQYAKNAYKWSEMQKAGEGLKELFADPILAKEQPNAIKYLKDYFKQNIGYGEHHAIARLEDSIRGLGMSPTMLNEGVGNVKTFFIMQKLLVNSGYMASGLLQTTNVLPHFTILWGQGVFGNPITAAPVGVLGGVALATGHYGNLATRGGLGKGISLDSPFYKKAFRYAEDNGVTARSLMDESPIEASFNKGKRVVDIAAKLSMVPPEVVGRSISYMAFVEFLRSSGKFKGNDIGLFQKAEELTNASMVDYRSGERPMIFTKLGVVGNFLNTLMTFPMNWYQNWNLYTRQLSKGNPMPFMTAFAVQYAIAGAMGIPGFQDIDKLYQMVKDHVVSNEMYAKMRDHPFWNDPKVWMMQHFGHAQVLNWLSDKTGWGAHFEPKVGEGVYGSLSARSGIGITSRVTAPGGADMFQAPFGPAIDIGKQALNVGKAVLDPMNTTKRAQAAMGSVPPGTQGALEQAPFMEGLTYEKRDNGDIVPQRPGNIKDHSAATVRTPDEQKLRNWGLRSQREVVDRELGYRADRDRVMGQERAKDMIDEVYDAAKRGDKDTVRSLYSAYVKLTGKPISKEAWQQQVEQNYMSSMERAGKNAKRLPIADLKAYARIQAIMDEVENEHNQRNGSK